MPQNPLRIQGLKVKEESFYGADALPANTDGVRGVGFLWTGLDPEFAFPNRREDALSGSLIKPVPGTPEGRMARFTYAVELKGAGAAYSSTTPVRPEIDPLLRCCGLSRTHIDTGGAESVSYALADTGHVGASTSIYAGDKLFRLIGCRGNAVLQFQAGQIAQVNFEISGMLFTDPTEQTLDALTYDSVRPPAMVGAGLAIVPNGGASWSPESPSFEIDLGNEIVRLDTVNNQPLNPGGLAGFFVASRAPMLRLQARGTELSTYDPYLRAKTAVDHTVDATLGSVQYNRLDVDIEDARLVNDPGHEDDNSFGSWSLEYELQDLVLRFD